MLLWPQLEDTCASALTMALVFTLTSALAMVLTLVLELVLAFVLILILVSVLILILIFICSLPGFPLILPPPSPPTPSLVFSDCASVWVCVFRCLSKEAVITSCERSSSAFSSAVTPSRCSRHCLTLVDTYFDKEEEEEEDIGSGCNARDACVCVRVCERVWVRVRVCERVCVRVRVGLRSWYRTWMEAATLAARWFLCSSSLSSRSFPAADSSSCFRQSMPIFRLGEQE